ncbi:hypothetical protein N9N97_03165 [Rickettsiaceae bacterium]|nr:hypothetical protein [Rickettsiaceae bacterium]
MSQKNTISAFFPYVLCSFAFFLMVFINGVAIDEHIEADNISFTERDNIKFLIVIGYIVASIMLLVLIRFFSMLKLIIAALLIHFVSVLSIVFLYVPTQVFLFYFVVYSSSSLTVMMLMLGYFLSEKKLDDNYSLSLYSCSILLAYTIVVEMFEHIDFDIGVEITPSKLIMLNILPIAVFIQTILKYDVYTKDFGIKEYRFFGVMRHMHLEALVAFVVLYSAMVIMNGYELYALARSFPVMGGEFHAHVMMLAVGVALLIAPTYVARFNKHKISIYTITLMIMLFAMLPLWGQYDSVDDIVLFLLAVLAYTLVACSLMLLSEKFRGVNLFIALAIYAMMGSFGFYCGYITIEKVEVTLGDNGFLAAICFVLFGLLVYYVHLFRTLKLYRA